MACIVFLRGLAGLRRGGAMHDDEVYGIVGTFDPTAAATVAAKLRHIGVGTRVVLDFTRARDVSPAALWVLATGIAPHSRIILRGLPHHEQRLLEYLGIRSTDEDFE